MYKGLCNDENVQPNNFYTDKGRVREGLAIAVAMGANTVSPSRILNCQGNGQHLIPIECTGPTHFMWSQCRFSVLC